MKTCPNPQCKTTGLPDDAKFCPKCGTMLQKEAPLKKMTISECRLVPSIIKKGEQCRLVWKGENVKYIEIDYQHYDATRDIILTPSQSYTYRVSFGGEGSAVSKEVQVTVKSPYLYDGKGEDSGVEGKWTVDVRQCKRTEGLGWNGLYAYKGKMPAGYDGFYAMFDESESIQILVIDGKLDTIFLKSEDYEMRIWRDEKEEKFLVEEGWIFKDYVTKYRYKEVTFFCMYQDGVEIPDKSTKNAEICLSSILDKFVDAYKKEFYDFFGISWEQLMEDAEYYESE